MTNHATVEPPKYLARPGQIWLTAKGHRVLIVAGPGGAEMIEAHYLDGKVDGYGAAIFDLHGKARHDGDQLVERIEQPAAAMSAEQ